MEEVKSMTAQFQEFKNINKFNIKIGEIDYILSISESETNINFSLTQKERNEPFEYEENYSLDKLIKINNIFKMFDSIHTVRKSFESLLNAKKYSFEKNDENIIFTVQINIFEEITDVSFVLNKKKLSKEEIESIVNKQIYQIKELKIEIDNLKIKHDKEIKELNKEIKEIKDQNKELIKSNQKLIDMFTEQEKKFSFSFRNGKNYTLYNNGKTAEKTRGGNDWNCTIVGDTRIPKNKISKWEIKLKKFKITKNTVNTFIGIGPNNPQNKTNFYNYCWSLSCGEPKIWNNSNIITLDYPGNLKEGDIIKVIVDMKNGILSFKINNSNYNIQCSNIPINEELYPIVLINDMNQMVEILD